MRRSSIVLAAAALTACGGHTSSPSAAATPAAATGRAAAPAGPPTTLRYAPGTGRYRIESVVHSVTEVMGQSQVVDATTTLLVSATTANDPSGNIAATFVVDSASATGQTPGGGGTPDVSALRGKTFRAVFTPAGRPVSLTVPDTADQVVAQMGETFREFFPTLPPAQIAAGATWTDTTSNSTRQGGNNIRTRSIRTHRVVGWEQQGGASALHINTTGAYTIAGDGEAQGQAITMSGAGTATSERFVSAAGAFQSLSTSDSANINVTVVSMGLEIPVRQSRRSTITRLP